MRARSQQYAETIYELVTRIQDLSRSDQKRYAALCHSFPLVVRENGLAAAFGFLAAKGPEGSPEYHLLTHYARVLDAPDPDTLRQTVISTDLDGYKRITWQTLAAAEWFKRYAEGVLKVGSTGEDQDEEEDNRDA